MLLERAEERQVEDLQQPVVNALLPFPFRRAQLPHLIGLGFRGSSQSRRAPFHQRFHHVLSPENIGNARRRRPVFSARGVPQRSLWRSTIALATGEAGSKSRSGTPPSMLAETRSEEHTSELQSQSNLVCRLLLEKKKNNR